VARAGEANREFARRIDDGILVLCSLVTESVGWATAALLDEDVERADQVIADDRSVDERCAELSGLVKERLGTAAADPVELEWLVAVLQIIPELERSADLSEHIARRSRRGLGGIISPRSRGLIQSMADVTVRMWLAVGLAYRQRSLDASFELVEADKELDGLAASLVGESVSPGASADVAVDLALVARFYERLGDHAVNLARRVEAMAAPRRLTLPKLTNLRSAATRVPAKAGRLRRTLARLSHFRLVPTDEGFLDLFQAAAINVRDCADELSKLSVSYVEDNEHFDKIKSLERRGDQHTRDILLRLDASFVIPFDREDIHKLAEELGDVVKAMMAAASLIQLAQVEQPIGEISELAELTVEMAEQLVGVVDCLSTSSSGARRRLEQIEHLERQGEAIFRQSMARLFGGEYDTLDVIKEKDILQALEQSLTAMEDVSDVVESILVKNS
jgi:predicted phosphate transport protein (TIGR00153 family)